MDPAHHEGREQPKIEFDYDRVRKTLVPKWTADAPFAAQAGFVEGGRLYIGRLDATELRFASAVVGENGLVMPKTGDAKAGVWKESRIERNRFPGAERLIGSTGYWFLPAGGSAPKRMYMMEAGKEERESENPDAFEIPLSSVEDVDIEGSLVFALGRNSGATWVIGKEFGKLSMSPEWLQGFPVEDDRVDAALMSSPERLVVAGGEIPVAGKLAMPLTVFTAEYDKATGKPTSWAVIPRPVAENLGAVRGAEVNEAFVLLSQKAYRNPTLPGAKDQDAPTSAAMDFAYLRQSRYLSAWRTVPLENPALLNALPIGNTAEHQVIIAGGEEAASKKPNTRLWAYRLPATESTLSEKAGVVASVAKKEKEWGSQLTVDYRAGKVRAQEESRYHLVLVLDDSQASQTLRSNFVTNRSMHLMIEDCVVSEPSAADREEVQKLIGTTVAPAIGLLGPDGRLLGKFEGVPDGQQLHEFLKPMWGG